MVPEGRKLKECCGCIIALVYVGISDREVSEEAVEKLEVSLDEVGIYFVLYEKIV